MKVKLIIFLHYYATILSLSLFHLYVINNHFALPFQFLNTLRLTILIQITRHHPLLILIKRSLVPQPFAIWFDRHF